MSAASRYYAKNRETICARMRERDAEKRAALREAAADPVVAEELREEWREKYHRNVESRITRQLRGYLEDPNVSTTFKQFVRQCVWEHRSTLPPAFVRGLGRLTIAAPFPKDFPDIQIDGHTSPGSTPGAAENEA